MANDTKYITLENLTRLASKIKADIQLKQDQLQFAELPDATTCSGKVVQYVGDDTVELKAGAFYKSDGTTWAQVNTTEVPEPIEQTLALVNSLPAWADADASKVYAVKQTGVAYTDVYIAGTPGEAPADQDGFILVGSNDQSKTPSPTYMIVFNGIVTEDDLATINAVQVGVPHYMPSNGKLYMQAPEGTDVDAAIAEMNGAGTAKANRWIEVDAAAALNFSLHTYTARPSYADMQAADQADKANGANLVYFIVTEPAESSLGFYAKKADETGAWYTVQTSGAAQPVDLPTFAAISDAGIEAAFEG